MRSIIEQGDMVLFLVTKPTSIVLIGKFGCWVQLEIGTLATKSPNDASILSRNFVDAVRHSRRNLCMAIRKVSIGNRNGGELTR